MSTARILRQAAAIAATILLLATSTPLSLVNPTGVLADSRVVTSLADDGSEGTLRYAIENSAAGDTITFAAGLNGTIYLDSNLGALLILHELTIDGPGAHTISIDGGNETRVLVIAVGDIVPIEDIEDLVGAIGDISGVEAAADLMPGEPAAAFQPAVVVSGLTLCNGSVDLEPESVDDLFKAVGGNVLVLGSSAAFRDCIIKEGAAIGGGGMAAAASLLSLERCTIRRNTAGGLEDDVFLSGGGGGLLTALAYVTAEDCSIEENTVDSGNGLALGGGGAALISIWDFSGCDIHGNVAHDGETIPGMGGGIVSLLSLCNLSGCDIRDNIAGDSQTGGLGGGILAIYNILLNVQECTIAGNAAGVNGSGIGGGMLVGQALLGGSVVRDSLIANNTAGSDDAEMALGGGIAVAEFLIGVGLPEMFPHLSVPGLEPGQPDVLSLHLVNSTVSGNAAATAAHSTGGGIWAAEEILVGLSFCTITENTADWGGGLSTVPMSLGGAEPGQGYFGTLLLKNSVVAGNTALMEAPFGGVSVSSGGGGNDILGPIVSLYGNIIGDPEGWEESQDGDSEYVQPSSEECDDIVGVNARLGPLADNGGPTLTHALLPGSPALDAACDGLAITEYIVPFDDIVAALLSLLVAEPGDSAPAANGDGAPVVADQRGMMRPVDGDGDGEADWDSGAFEASPDINLPGVVADTAGAAITRVGECTQFRVRVANEGDAVLLIDRIEIVGRSAGDFSVVGNPAGQKVLPGRSIELTLRFCPRSAGDGTATLIIYSNDPFENPVQVRLTGTGLAEKREDNPDPASMSMSYLRIDPAQVLPGQQVVISANVCNSGEEKGSLSATLTVNGSAEQSQSIAVSGGCCKEVLFIVAKAVPGTYQVAIDGMTGQFSVLAPRTVQGTVASRQYTGLGTGGLIAIAAIVVVLVVALVYVFRRE